MLCFRVLQNNSEVEWEKERAHPSKLGNCIGRVCNNVGSLSYWLLTRCCLEKNPPQFKFLYLFFFFFRSMPQIHEAAISSLHRNGPAGCCLRQELRSPRFGPRFWTLCLRQLEIVIESWSGSSELTTRGVLWGAALGWLGSVSRGGGSGESRVFGRW